MIPPQPWILDPRSCLCWPGNGNLCKPGGSQPNLIQLMILHKPCRYIYHRLSYIITYLCPPLPPSPHFLLQSLIFLACVGAAGLGLSLLVLAVYLVVLCCCCRSMDEDSKRPEACCVSWVAVATGLILW